jgi:hypothetical protein
MPTLTGIGRWARVGTGGLLRDCALKCPHKVQIARTHPGSSIYRCISNVRKENDQDSTSVLSLLAGELIRAAYQLCQALADDLEGIERKPVRRQLKCQNYTAS